MSCKIGVPKLADKKFYVTEGGVETEIMYKHGFDFPNFSAFELLKNPDAMMALDSMYREYFRVVDSNNAAALVGGLDYRASPDWGKLLGYSATALEDINHQCIEFLRSVGKKYGENIDTILYQGLIGPRGDAYEVNETITAAESEDYHSVQLQTLKSIGVDIASALTFNSIEEAIGLARAAKNIEIPLSISFITKNEFISGSNTTLKDAVVRVDDETGGSVEFFMVNCAHPVEYEPAFKAKGNWTNRIRGVRPNAAKMELVDLCKIGHLEDGDPIELGQQVANLVDRFPHMDVLGGCCGTWEKHLDQIAGKVSIPV